MEDAHWATVGDGLGRASASADYQLARARFGLALAEHIDELEATVRDFEAVVGELRGIYDFARDAGDEELTTELRSYGTIASTTLVITRAAANIIRERGREAPAIAPQTERTAGAIRRACVCLERIGELSAAL